MTISKCSTSRRATARAALATDCVLVPIPTALADPEPFTAETLAPIQLGHTTRDEVRSLFAAWRYTTDDGVQTAHIEPEISDNVRYWVFGLSCQPGGVCVRYAHLLVLADELNTRLSAPVDTTLVSAIDLPD
jgi:hypothetical protein